VVRAPSISAVGAMPDPRDRPFQSRLFVKDQIRRYSREAQRLHFKRCDCHPHTVMLNTSLVTKSLAILVDDNIAVRWHAHDKRRLKFRELVSHGRSHRLHMPEIRSKLLRELESISRISGISIGEDRITCEKLSLEFFAVLKPSGRQHDCFAGMDVKRFIVLLSCDTDNFITESNDCFCSCVTVDGNFSPL